MTWLTIDKDKCNKDGLCAAECPAGIIVMGDNGPLPVSGGQDFCLYCGHCVAICPKAALTLDGLSPDQCLVVTQSPLFDRDTAEQFLRSRRSIRRYKDIPVPRKDFEKALELACHAPTGSNRQPVKWLVLDNAQDVQKAAGHVIDWMRSMMDKAPEMARSMKMPIFIRLWRKGVDRICRNAPALVFAYAADDIRSAPADCHTALAYLELALPAFGLGSCWAGYMKYAAEARWPGLQDMVNFPEGHTCHGALLVGIPKFRFPRAPKRNLPDLRYYRQ